MGAITPSKTQDGFGLMQVLIAVSLLSMLSLGTTQYFRFQQSAMKANRTYSDKDILVSRLSGYIVDNGTLSASAGFAGGGGFPDNSAFKSCVLGGGIGSCSTTPGQGLVLVDTFGNVVAGTAARPQYYDNGGQVCATGPSPDCGIEAFATFAATCQGGAASCALSKNVKITFTVRQAPGVVLASNASIKSTTLSSTSAIPLSQTSSGTVNHIPVWLTETTLGDSIVTQVGAQLGIGNVVDPQGTLHVAATGGAPGTILLEASTTGSTSPRVSFVDTAVGGNASNSPVWSMQSSSGNLSVMRQKIQAATPLPRLTLTQDGRIGAGTSTPSGLISLETDRPLTESANDLTNLSYSDIGDPAFLFWHLGGTQAAPLPVALGRKIGTPLAASGYTSAGTFGIGPSISFQSTSDFATALPSAMLRFRASSSGPDMIIADGGYVGMGTLAPTERLHVVGNMRIQGLTDCVLGGGSAASLCTSDALLKENVSPIREALDRILRIRGVEYEWSSQSTTPGRHDVGVIAQEVEKEFPALVTQDEASGYKRVSYGGLIAPLIESVRGLNSHCEWAEAGRSGLHTELRELRAAVRKAAASGDALAAENSRLAAENDFLDSALKILATKAGGRGK